MPVSVFPVLVSYPTGHSLMLDLIVNSYGDGYEQRIVKNVAFSRADGEGTVSAYKGINRFSLKVDSAPYGSTKKANVLWAFFKARMNANCEAFYLYVFPEAAAIDLTGVATVGRYLVRFAELNLTRELFTHQLFNHSLEVVEVRA